MGGDHSSTGHPNSLNVYDWNHVANSNGARVLVNRNNQNEVVEEYPIAISDAKQLDLAEELYQLRSNDP